MIKPIRFKEFIIHGSNTILVQAFHPDGKVLLGKAHCNEYDAFDIKIGRAIAKLSAEIRFLEYHRKTYSRSENRVLKKILKTFKTNKMDIKSIKIIKNMIALNEKESTEIHKRLKELRTRRDAVIGE